jgi:hypothetical protein
MRQIKSFYKKWHRRLIYDGPDYLIFVKNFKKMLRIAGMIMLIALASFGVGLIGGVPIPMNKRRENVIELRIELKESEEHKAEELIFKNQE